MSIVRGSELLRHQLAMFLGTVRCAVVFALLTLGFWFWISPPIFTFFEDGGWDVYRAYWFARGSVALRHTQGLLTVPTRDGDQRWTVTDIVTNETIQEFVEAVNGRLVETMYEGGLAAGLGLCLWLLIAGLYGYRAGQDQSMAGTQLASRPLFCARQVLSWWRWSTYRVGGVRMPRSGETLHTLILGSTGTGKTTAILDLLDQIRAQGAPGIIYDPDGTFISNYYRDNHDVILNVCDARMPDWNPGADCFEPQHYEDFAAAMMARDPRESGEQIWDIGAMHFIAGGLEVLKREGRCTSADLYQFLATLPIEEIEPWLEGLPAGAIMNTHIERVAFSVRFTALKRAGALRYLPDTPSDDAFSIRQFVNNPGDRWLFLSSRADMRAMLRPLLTIWLHLATTALLSLPPSLTRRLWFLIDETASINRLPALTTLLQEGRRFGASVVLGLQSLSQLSALYGEQEATTILSIPQTTLALRTPDYTTAEAMAKRLGEHVFVESREALQFGAHPTRDGVSMSHQYTKRYLVEPAALQCLPDRTGYLKLPGAWLLVPVSLPVRQRQPITQPLIPRAMTVTARRQDSKPHRKGDQGKTGKEGQAKTGKDIDPGLSGLVRDLTEPEGLTPC